MEAPASSLESRVSSRARSGVYDNDGRLCEPLNLELTRRGNPRRAPRHDAIDARDCRAMPVQRRRVARCRSYWRDAGRDGEAVRFASDAQMDSEQPPADAVAHSLS